MNTAHAYEMIHYTHDDLVAIEFTEQGTRIGKDSKVWGLSQELLIFFSITRVRGLGIILQSSLPESSPG